MKTAVLLAVRTVSRRLTHKILRQVGGKTVLEHTVARLRRAEEPEDVIVCTSINKSDDIIADMAESHGWTCFRGAEDDVLERVYKAAEKHGVDMVVRATGDNMFVCPEHIDWMLGKHRQAGADWATVDGLPWGMKSETFTFEALKRAYLYAEDTSMSEYLTWYFDQPQYFKTLHLEAREEYRRPDYRVTMDTADDLEFVRRVCEQFDKRPSEITTRELIELLDRMPDLVAINAQVADRIHDKAIRAQVNTRILDIPRSSEIQAMDAASARMPSGANVARIRTAGFEPLPAIPVTPGKWIGDEQPVFVVAEIGQNHNGSLDIAKQLIDVAAQCGVDAVKSCKRDLTREMTAEAWSDPYVGPQSFGNTRGEHREELELSAEQHAELFEYCRAKGVEYFVSACDIPSVEVLEQIGVNLYKVASRDIRNLPLLQRIAQTGKPVILAAGMADEEDIADALLAIRKHHSKVIVAQCTSEYPTPYEDCNLLAIHSLRRTFNVLTGLSDHTVGIMTAVVGAAMGACMVEKHVTLARYMKGTDHACSLEPDGLRRVVRDIRNVERALGSGLIRVPDGVEAARIKLDRSLVSKTSIPAGTLLTEAMLCLKSPGTGLPWRDRNLIVGKSSRRDISADSILCEEDFD